MSRFYLTTAIDYVNSRPHLGTAYEKVTADVIARYRRLCGLQTRFLMGNDEHSQNVYLRAKELGMEPLAFCDQMEQEFRRVWERLEISFDDFIRTTEARHKTSVTTMVRRIAETGDLYEGFYEGWYCVSCEAFKQEKDLVAGCCPVHKTRRSGSVRRIISFGCRSTGRRCWIISPSIPSFFSPTSAGTRSSGCWKEAWKTSP